MKNIITLGFLVVFIMNLEAQVRYDISFPLEGHMRECIVVKPSTPPPVGGYPVVFMLHGTSGDGQKFYDISGWKELGEQENFITVFPSSLRWCFVDDGVEEHNTRWVNGNVTDNPCSGPPQDYVDDVKFLKILANRIADTFPVNKGMIFCSGFSNGSAMIHKLAIDAGDVFAAVAGASGPLAEGDSSRPVNRIPVWFIVGTLDDRFIKPPFIELPFGGDSILGYLKVSLNRALVCQGLDTSFIKKEQDFIHTYQFLKSSPGENSKPYLFSLLKGMTHQYPNGSNYPFDGPKFFWEFFKRSVIVNTKSNNKDKQNIAVYPNPSNETIQIQFTESNLSKVNEINIFNAYGQSVLTNFPVNRNPFILNKKDFGPGLFLLQVKIQNKIITKKFIFN